ncbi:beta-1,2-xylosyltransferase XYXT1-like [Lolium perenne]|uniref:beta-1,2-xylosyltransferase XYXT1-like n=1 Tax=Lolium perenne TaxID=4522 RepID=UPI0021F62641|nr:beta-1,2-xylosyltransferase XYXT1-like [Lolium perenne]
MMVGRNLSGGAAAACLLVPLLILVVLKTDCVPQITRLRETSIAQVSDFFVSIRPYGQVPLSQDNRTASNQVHHPGEVWDETVHKVSPSGLASQGTWQQQQPLDAVKLKVADDSVAEAPPSPASKDEIAGDGGVNEIKDVAAPRSKLSCNFSGERMDICAMEGDVRMHGKSATVYLLAASDDSYQPENGTVTIRPYPRKWEIPTMEMIRELTIHSGDTDTVPVPPQCTVTHDVPAVVFSTGGYSRNFYHSMTDIVIPLYNTAREYEGRVQLVATDYSREWVSKYRHVLAALSVYPVIDFDADDAVRCFPSAHIGIESHEELGINPTLSRNGYTMMDFRDFLQSAYSLKRSKMTPVSRSSGKRPRLVIMLRRHSRAITNEAEAVAAASKAGFEVVAAGPEAVRDMGQFAEVVNSCDVMVGVHGAGLANMLFLPHNGTVVQIIPWGEMKWPCWHEFGRPVPDMGLQYAEYEATAEETTLKEVYPRDHAVFTDPLSIHKQGFGMVWSIFLNGQNVTLDVDRFRGLMQQIYQSVTIT